MRFWLNGFHLLHYVGCFKLEVNYSFMKTLRSIIGMLLLYGLLGGSSGDIGQNFHAKKAAEIVVEDSTFFAYSLEEAMESPDKVVGLMLEGYDYFPEEIFKLHRLGTLFLGNCTFPEFPPSISQLKQLWRIYFSEPPFIPKGISQIQNLTTIELAGFASGDPPIHTFQISDEVSRCPNLKNIRVKICDPVGLEKFENIENAFFYMVDSTMAFSGICNWKKLKRLSLADIGTQKLPSCIYDLPELDELKIVFTTLKEISVPPNVKWKKVTLIANQFSETEIERLKNNPPADTVIFEQELYKWSFP